MTEVRKAYSQYSLTAVQVGYDTTRVTFQDIETFKEAQASRHVPIFSTNCSVVGGGLPPVMVHIFDYPAEMKDDTIKCCLALVKLSLLEGRNTSVLQRLKLEQT